MYKLDYQPIAFRVAVVDDMHLFLVTLNNLPSERASHSINKPSKAVEAVHSFNCNLNVACKKRIATCRMEAEIHDIHFDVVPLAPSDPRWKL